MTVINLNGKEIDADANGTVINIHIDCGFEGVVERKETSTPTTDNPGVAAAGSTKNSPRPIAFKITQKVSFPGGSAVTIIGDEPNDETVVASTERGEK